MFAYSVHVSNHQTRLTQLVLSKFFRMWLLLLEQVQVRRKYDARSCVLAQLCVVCSTSSRPPLEAGHLVLGLVFKRRRLRAIEGTGSHI